MVENNMHIGASLLQTLEFLQAGHIEQGMFLLCWSVISIQLNNPEYKQLILCDKLRSLWNCYEKCIIYLILPWHF